MHIQSPQFPMSKKAKTTIQSLSHKLSLFLLSIIYSEQTSSKSSPCQAWHYASKWNMRNSSKVSPYANWLLDVKILIASTSQMPLMPNYGWACDQSHELGLISVSELNPLIILWFIELAGCFDQYYILVSVLKMHTMKCVWLTPK